MTTETAGAKRGSATSSTTRVQRFRSKHRRLEYVPGANALNVIDTWRTANPSLPLSAILDHLIVAGNTALIAGNALRGRR